MMAVALSDNGSGDGSMDTGDNDTCLQLALEGEKLCKAGNCRDGVAFFEAALQVNRLELYLQILLRSFLIWHLDYKELTSYYIFLLSFLVCICQL